MIKILCFDCGISFEIPAYITNPTSRCPDCNPEYYHEANCACIMCGKYCSISNYNNWHNEKSE
jgi:hypothetical protein